jgi:hypothetical protein
MSRTFFEPTETTDLLREIRDQLERIAKAIEKDKAGEPPLVDGCRIVHRSDGFDVCRVHYRYWKTGTEMCPGRNGL